jgi:hypothetical protein
MFFERPVAGKRKVTTNMFLSTFDKYLLRVIAYGKHFLYNVIFCRRHILIVAESEQKGLV